MSDINNSSVEKVLEKEGPGFFSKIIQLWVLPFIYAIILGSVILNFAGVNFHSQIKWIQDHTKGLYNTSKQTSSKTADSSTSNKKTAATSGVNSKSNTDKTNTDKVSLAKQSSTSKSNNQESAGQKDGSSVTNSLLSMDPSTAAKLLSNMAEVDALKNLKQLQPEVQSAIIAKLSPDEGARIIKALTSGDEPATTTTSASQLYQYMQPEQIVAILNGINNNEDILKQIKQLDPNTASKVISQLNPKVSGWIVTQLKP